MALYTVTTYTIRGDYDAVAAALETQLELVDTTKTIRLMTLVPRGSEFAGILVYDT